MDSKFVSPTHVCAVDIGGTKIACGIVTLNGTDAPNVQSVKKVPTNAKRVASRFLPPFSRQLERHLLVHKSWT